MARNAAAIFDDVLDDIVEDERAALTQRMRDHLNERSERADDDCPLPTQEHRER